MIDCNKKEIGDNFKSKFPDITNSNKKLYLFTETPTINNWKDIVLKNSSIFREYDKIIIDSRPEAPHFNVIKNMLDLFEENLVTDILILNSGLDDTFQYKSIFCPAFIRYEDNEYIKITDRTKLFVSLSRLIYNKFQRIYITYELYKNDLFKDGIVTCGCNEDDKDVSNENLGLNLFPLDFQNIIPLCFDGKINREDGSVFNMSIGKECLINLIIESSFDISYSKNYPSMQFNGGLGWNRQFLTEKTSKAFNSGQIPIFLSTKGYVSTVKLMGFDIFDDIINHSYDNENDPDKRIIMIVNELLRLRDIGVENLKLIYNLNERLMYNKTHLRVLNSQMEHKYKLMINSWFFNDLNK